MRACPVCASELTPRFASECDPPVAWSCPECGLFQLESGGRPFTPEESAVIASHGFAREPAHRGRSARRSPAITQARELLDAFASGIPIDVEMLAARLGYPVQWRSLPGHERGGVEGDPGHRRLVLNRDYPFHSDGERRWVVAEEVGHAVLGHSALVASDEPGRSREIREPQRSVQEREARAFAAELLMPAAQVRYAFERERPIILRALGSDERGQAVRTVIADLAREFKVSQQAMRLRLGELELLA